MPRQFQCTICRKICKSKNGLTQHQNATSHGSCPASPEPLPEHTLKRVSHRFATGCPCDEHGNFLPEGTKPLDLPNQNSADLSFHPFLNRAEFDFAWLHYVELQSSAPKITKSLDIRHADMHKFGQAPQWDDAADMYKTIDKIRHGHLDWKIFKFRYQGALPENPPKWMTTTYELHTLNIRDVTHAQFAARDLADMTRFVPVREFRKSDGKRVISDLMTADWIWMKVDSIAGDYPELEGIIVIPIISGLDKTTVSVATGSQHYHPVYSSPGNVTNSARRAHGSAVAPIAFLPIPKANRKQRKRPAYQRFCRELYHACLTKIFEPLRQYMGSQPDIIKCPDGHFRRAIYEIGPVIADYPEQVWLSGIVQSWCPKCDADPSNLDCVHAQRRSRARTHLQLETLSADELWDEYGTRPDILPFAFNFPRADIHELLSPDLLHQVIKGTFKDHIVTWVNEYLTLTLGEAAGQAVIDEIDRRLAAVPPFPGLRRFPEGRDFQQWTGNDSKALMKVYLPAISGLVDPRIVQCLSAFMQFCYLARRNSFTPQVLDSMETALNRFHEHRTIFVESGVRMDVSLPRQHSLKHYVDSIWLFGAPNGLCSSITESRHITAVKKPWRRSNRYQALLQMLLTNQRLSKLAAQKAYFDAKGMMTGTALEYTELIACGGVPTPPVKSGDIEDVNTSDVYVSNKARRFERTKLAATREPRYPRSLAQLAAHVDHPDLPVSLRRYLWLHTNPQHREEEVMAIAKDNLPRTSSKISVFHSAIAEYYAPSDVAGRYGMTRTRIRCHPTWWRGPPRYDTVLVQHHGQDPSLEMTGAWPAHYFIGRVHLLFAFKDDNGAQHECALIRYFNVHSERPDEDTGLWIVRPSSTVVDGGTHPDMMVVSVSRILRGVHLIPVYGGEYVPEDFEFTLSLDCFPAFYANAHADHHSHRVLASIDT